MLMVLRAPLFFASSTRSFEREKMSFKGGVRPTPHDVIKRPPDSGLASGVTRNCKKVDPFSSNHQAEPHASRSPGCDGI
jgi:hypothetical protein